MNREWKIQRQRITNISGYLRNRYYASHYEDICYFDMPNGIAGDYTESIGNWPEIIFNGTFCSRSLKGYCSPCFYSQFSFYNKEKGNSYNEMIRSQINYVIDHFDDIVLKRQNTVHDSNVPISFVITPTGSFFDEREFPRELRLEMLERLITLQKRYERPFHMRVEAHCRDWNSLDFDSQDTITELKYLADLHATILFGIESFDNYVREVLYNKHLDISEIETAYNTVRKFNLQMGSFIFAGLFSMNDKLTYSDVVESLRLAVSKNIAPVLMFQNVQQHTITDFLFQKHQISLIEPFTVMDIISKLGDICNMHDGCVDWLIADPRGGPPVPQFNIFDCSKVTSKENSTKIYQMICDLRLTRDFNSFITSAELLRMSDNYLEYLDFFKRGFNRDYLYQNTDQLLGYIEEYLHITQ